VGSGEEVALYSQPQWSVVGVPLLGNYFWRQMNCVMMVGMRGGQSFLGLGSGGLLTHLPASCHRNTGYMLSGVEIAPHQHLWFPKTQI
jgi:hypothetical protein